MSDTQSPPLSAAALAAIANVADDLISNARLNARVLQLSEAAGALTPVALGAVLSAIEKQLSDASAQLKDLQAALSRVQRPLR